MAKRYQQSKEFHMYHHGQQLTKKPKLDITITRGRSATTSSTRSTATHSSVDTKFGPQKPAAPLSNHDLWDDDDDDVVLLATQVAESQMAAAASSNSQFLNTQLDFAPNLYATTSTQKLNTVPVQSENDLISQLFCDEDDDDIIAAVMASSSTSKTTQVVNQQAVVTSEIEFLHMNTEPFSLPVANEMVDEELFKRPFPVPRVPSPSPPSLPQLSSEECRIKDLMEENARLEVNLVESKTKMQAKDGEASLLRDELRHLRNELQSLKMANAMTAETKRNETQLKLDKLSREVESMRAQLQLKEAESTNLRVRNLNETIQLKNQFNYNDDVNMDIDQMEQHHDSSVKNIDHNLRPYVLIDMDIQLLPSMKMHNVELDLLSTGLKKLYEPQVAAKAIAKNISQHRRNVFELELEQMHSIISQLYLERSHPKGSSENRQGALNRSIASMQRVFMEFWTYSRSLAFWHNCRIHPPLDRDNHLQLAGPRDPLTLFTPTKANGVIPPIISEQLYPHIDREDYQLLFTPITVTTDALLKPNPLHIEERLISFRRYIAALAIACRLCAVAFSSSLSTNNDIIPPQLSIVILRTPETATTSQQIVYAPLQIAIDALRLVSISREMSNHFGLFESFAALLLHMLHSFGDDDLMIQPPNAAELELLVNGLLREIIFARPYAWVFRDIAASLRYCATHLPKSLPLLCTNSPADSFITDRTNSLYRFTETSCILQVYAAQVEAILPRYVAMRPDHFILLTVICEDHLQFVYHCFEHAPRFIYDHLPNFYDDDDDDDDDDGDGDDDEIDGKENPNAEIEETTNMNDTAGTSKVNYTNRVVQYTCECFPRLCLSTVSLIFQLLHQWLLLERQETFRVSATSKLALQLLNIIFCDNYLTCLFREEEENTRWHLSLICSWWSQYAIELKFTEFHDELLTKLQNCHFLPKQTNEEEEKLGNVTADLKEWRRLVPKDEIPEDDRDDITDTVKFAEDLLLQAADEDKFFKSLKGYTLDFE